MKTAIVLGGTAGIGRAIVNELVLRNYKVGVVARGEDRLADLSRELKGSVVTACADVAEPDQIEAAADKLVAKLGAPDVWVNSAMATVFSAFGDMSPDEFNRVIKVTFEGQVNGTRAALRHMSKGKIVCIGSGLSYRSVPYQSAYCGAKHAINGFASSIRSELLREGSEVSIHLVQLPAVNTPQFDWARSRLSKQPQPAPPIFKPEVAAEGVMKVLDTGAREVLVGRSVLQLIFGDMIFPDWLDRKMAKSGVKAQKSQRPPKKGKGNLFKPVAYPSREHGTYSGRAESDGLIVDADIARKVLFVGGAVAIFSLGLIIG